MIGNLEAVTRRANEAALMAADVIDQKIGEVYIAWALFVVYGDEISADVAAAAAAAPSVVAVAATDEGKEALAEISRLTAEPLGRAMGELVVAHAVAITRLAEMQNCSRVEAAEDLVRLAATV